MVSNPLALAFMSLLALTACSKSAEEKKKELPPLPVTVVQSGYHTMQSLEESVGVLESLADPVVSAEYAGRVIEVRVAAGSEIEQGQVLAVVDSGDAGLSRRAVVQLEAMSREQARDLERLKKLREQDAISQQVLNDAIARQAATQKQLASARAQADLAARNIGRGLVLAPVSGRVDKQLVVMGQSVRVGEPMFQVVALQRLRARLPFPETVANRIKRGMTVQLSVAGGARILSGKIDGVRPMAAVGSRSFDAFVQLDNPGDWHPGATVAATIVLEERKNAVSVPERCVILRPDGKVVYVVQDGKAKQRVVQTGIMQDGLVEIIDGLQANESVVLDGAGFLSDGAAVTVNSRQ